MARRAVNAVRATGDQAEELLDAIAGYDLDPLGFVLFAFPWGEAGTQLQAEPGPDTWQVEFLTEFGEAVRSRATDAELGALLMATVTGHGVGKSALLAWIIIWFMSCREDPAIIVTANTLGQLSGKTWRELAKWHRLSINHDWFQWTATKLYLKDRPETHFAQAVPWSKERSEAFAGTHAKHVMILFDEGSAIDDVIYEVTEGALTTQGAIWLVFGNGTRNTGRFREAFRKFRHRWIGRTVDSRTARKANLAQLNQWVEDYGEDSDFVRVRVRGEFPHAASMQLIGSDLVEQARLRFKAKFGDRFHNLKAQGPGWTKDVQFDDNPLAPKILSVDVARYGADQSVIGLRQGRVFLPLAKHRGLDVVQLAYRVSEWLRSDEFNAVFVDEGGVGAGVVDVLRDMGFEITAANAGMKALEDKTYENRRAEMWTSMKDWLTHGGMIPYDDSELEDDLIGPEYGFAGRGDRIQLESKDDMRSRGLPSPDTGDTLAQTFFLPVAPRQVRGKSVAQQLMALGRRPTFSGAGGGKTWMSN